MIPTQCQILQLISKVFFFWGRVGKGGGGVKKNYATCQACNSGYKETNSIITRKHKHKCTLFSCGQALESKKLIEEWSPIY